MMCCGRAQMPPGAARVVARHHRGVHDLLERMPPGLARFEPQQVEQLLAAVEDDVGAAKRTSRRTSQLVSRQPACAARAACTACSTSSGVHLGTAPSGSPVAGLSTSIVSRSPVVLTRSARPRMTSGVTRSDFTWRDAERMA